MDPLDPRRTALLADLPGLIAAATLWEHGVNPRATFEIGLRTLPPDHGFAVAAGLEQAAQALVELQFADDQVAWLRTLFVFHNLRREFWDFLKGVRFSGDLWALPEATPAFPGEPLLRVTAPLLEGCLVGSQLLAGIAAASAAATRTARLLEAAGGRPVLDFGPGGSHGHAAGVLAARAAYLVGGAGGSSLEAGHRLGVQLHGAMPGLLHLAFPDAVRAYHAVFPDSAHLPLGTGSGEGDLQALVERLAELKPAPRSLRLDRGAAGLDLAERSRALRAALDRAGLKSTRIAAGGDLDEHEVARLAGAGAPIDQFVIGGEDARLPPPPVLDLGYELVALSAGPGEASLPGTRQAYRRFSSEGAAQRDLVALAEEKQFGAPLLAPVIEAGVKTAGMPGLETMREHARRQLRALPAEVRRLRGPETYPVARSEELQARLGAGGGPR